MTDLASGVLVVSFSMLTVNADEYPVVRQFHNPGDEKRTLAIIVLDLHDVCLRADPVQAATLMSWTQMPKIGAMPAIWARDGECLNAEGVSGLEDVAGA